MKKLYYRNGKKFNWAIPYVNISLDNSLILKRITKDNLDSIIKSGLLIEVEESNLITVTYLRDELLKDYLNVSSPVIHNLIIDNFNTKIKRLYKFNPSGMFEKLLRIAAIKLDERFSDNIKTVKDLYVVNQLNGKVMKTTNSQIKRWNHIAVFRSMDDAKIALNSIAEFKKQLGVGK